MNDLLEPFEARQWLAETDPRLRLTTTVLLLLVIGLTDSLLALLFIAVSIIAFAFLAGFTAVQLLKRLLILELFVLFLTLFLPFTTPGSPVFSLFGYQATHEGFQLTLIIMLRVGSSVLLTLALLTSQSTHQLAQAMSSLGLPNKLCWLFLMTVRYVHVLADEYYRMRESMKARAFRPGPNRHTWQSYSWLIGMLLVRSMNKSETLLQSMRCRGFTDQFVSLNAQSWRKSDTLLMLGVLLIAGLWLYVGVVL